MKRSFVMPKLGLTMTEGVLAEWTVQPGARFERDQTVFVVETDKTTNDVPAEAAGVLLAIVQQAGATVSVGEVIGYWDDGHADRAASRNEPLLSESLASGPAAAVVPEAVAQVRESETPPVGARIVATPLARRAARQHGIDLAQAIGTGPNGRIRHGDLPLAAHGAPKPRREQPDRMAATTARRLVQSKQEIPHFYLAREADARELLAMREQFSRDAGAKLTLNTFLLAAVGRALVDEPWAARVWDHGQYVHLGDEVGMAVHTDRGLFAPVVRQAGTRAIALVARDAQALAQRARDRELQAGDMDGAAITVSNAGMFNVTSMTPIINPGQAMILGVGSVRELFRPGADGLPELRREIGLVLACDHRVLDGASGLRFLSRVVRYLEHPALLTS